MVVRTYENIKFLIYVTNQRQIYQFYLTTNLKITKHVLVLIRLKLCFRMYNYVHWKNLIFLSVQMKRIR